MKLPRHRLAKGSSSLSDMIRTDRREEEARARHARDFDLGELMLQVRSRDSFGKERVRRAIPAQEDEELVKVVDRLLKEASSYYSRMNMQWQRQLIGYLTSLGAEAMARLGLGELEIPSCFDYVGLEADGTAGHSLAIKAEEVGDHCGLKASFLVLRAGKVGDHCFTHSDSCMVVSGRAGHFLGERSQGMRVRAGEVGDWLLLESKGARAEVRRAGRLAGLDSHDLEMHVDYASYELGARSFNATIYVYRGVLSMGLSGNGVVYLAPEIGPVRTCFEMRPLP